MQDTIQIQEPVKAEATWYTIQHRDELIGTISEWLRVIPEADRPAIHQLVTRTIAGDIK